MYSCIHAPEWFSKKLLGVSMYTDNFLSQEKLFCFITENTLDKTRHTSKKNLYHFIHCFCVSSFFYTLLKQVYVYIVSRVRVFNTQDTFLIQHLTVLWEHTRRTCPQERQCVCLVLTTASVQLLVAENAPASGATTEQSWRDQTIFVQVRIC